MSYTKGPWKTNIHQAEEYGDIEYCSYAVHGANELQIATVISECIDEHKANARLISKAPEMLEMIQQIRKYFCPDESNPDGVMIVDCNGADVLVWMGEVDALISEIKENEE